MRATGKRKKRVRQYGASILVRLRSVTVRLIDRAAARDDIPRARWVRRAINKQLDRENHD